MKLPLFAMALASPCVADSPLAGSSGRRQRILGRERSEHKDERREEKRLKRLKRKEKNGSKPGHGHHSPKSPDLKSPGLKSPDRRSPVSSKTSKSHYSSSPDDHKSWSSPDDSPKPTPRPTKDEEHGWWGAWPAEHATDAPTEKPTKKPTKSPTRRPTKGPTRPTTRPTTSPTKDDQFRCYENPDKGGTWPVCPDMDDEDFCDGLVDCDTRLCDCDAGQVLCVRRTNLCDPKDVFLIVDDGKGYRIPDGNDYNFAAVVGGSKLHVLSGASIVATNVLRSESAILVLEESHLEVRGEDIEVVGAQELGGNGIEFYRGSKGHVGCAEPPARSCQVHTGRNEDDDVGVEQDDEFFGFTADDEYYGNTADCEEDEFCKLEDEMCTEPGTTYDGVCAKTPDACYEIYQPVCDCEGKEWPNDCKAYAAGKNIFFNGPCPDPPKPPPSEMCAAGRDVDPKYGMQNCGDRDFCELEEGECENGAEQRLGTCSLTPRGCDEEEEVVEFVCGCDGNTYASKCEANARGTNVRFGGACPVPENRDVKEGVVDGAVTGSFGGTPFAVGYGSAGPTTACDNAGILIAGGHGGDYAPGGTALGAFGEGTVVQVRGATLRAGATSMPGAEGGHALYVTGGAKVAIHAGDLEGPVLVENGGNLVVHGGFFKVGIVVRGASKVHFRGCFGDVVTEPIEEYDSYVFTFVGKYEVKTMIYLWIHVDSPDPQFTELSSC